MLWLAFFCNIERGHGPTDLSAFNLGAGRAGLNPAVYNLGSRKPENRGLFASWCMRWIIYIRPILRENILSPAPSVALKALKKSAFFNGFALFKFWRGGCSRRLIAFGVLGCQWCCKKEQATYKKTGLNQGYVPSEGIWN